MYVSAGTSIAHFVGTNLFKQSYLMESYEIILRRQFEVRIWHIIWLESKVSENICILKINVNHKSGGKTTEAGVTCKRAPSNGQ